MANVEVVSESDRHNKLVQALSGGLSDDYHVIVAPTISGTRMDVVVVGVQGIFVLVDNCDRKHEAVRNAGVRLRQDLGTLTTLVQDRFTHMDPSLFGIVVCDEPAPQEPGNTPLVISLEQIAAYIVDLPASDQVELLDGHSREQVAHLLIERNKGVKERTDTPFVFQPLGGRHTVGHQFWTIQDAIRYMDAHPEAGIGVIEDGSLEQWLYDEGAIRLAESAAGARMTAAIDRRIPLEQFLISTGLVKRPALRATPPTMDFGFVLPQSTYTRRLRISKARGNGYLYGTLETDSPWLSVAPNRYYDGQVEAEVQVDGSHLERLPGNYEGSLLVESGSSQDVLQIPVKLRLLELPTTADRKLWRPLLHALVLGLWGGILGLFWSIWAPSAFRAFPDLAWYAYPAIAVGVWMILGFVGGRVQPANWPAWYAILRVWARAVIWGLGLGALASMMYWSWEGMPSATPITGDQLLQVVVPVGLLGSLLGIFPTAVGELQAHYREREYPPEEFVNTRHLFWRRTVGAVLLVAVLLIAPRFIRPQWDKMAEAGAFEYAVVWAQQRWTDVEGAIRGYVNDWYLERNDPRAANDD